MNIWREFLDSLDSSGGHIVLLMCLLVIMQTLAACHVQGVDQFRGECIGALLYALKGAPTK